MQCIWFSSHAEAEQSLQELFIHRAWHHRSWPHTSHSLHHTKSKHLPDPTHGLRIWVRLSWCDIKRQSHWKKFLHVDLPWSSSPTRLVLGSRESDHFNQIYSFLFFFFVVLGFEFRVYTLSHSSPLCVVFFEIGSHKLFAQAGFEPWSSWSLPLE
jgi:hypothetical protein